MSRTSVMDTSLIFLPWIFYPLPSIDKSDMDVDARRISHEDDHPFSNNSANATPRSIDRSLVI